jgi:hypothetical protein
MIKLIASGPTNAATHTSVITNIATTSTSTNAIVK